MKDQQKIIIEIDNKIELQIKKLLKFSLTEVVQIVHILTNISKEKYITGLYLKND